MGRLPKLNVNNVSGAAQSPPVIPESASEPADNLSFGPKLCRHPPAWVPPRQPAQSLGSRVRPFPSPQTWRPTQGLSPRPALPCITSCPYPPSTLCPPHGTNSNTY